MLFIVKKKNSVQNRRLHWFSVSLVSFNLELPVLNLTLTLTVFTLGSIMASYCVECPAFKKKKKQSFPLIKFKNFGGIMTEVTL